MASSRSIRVLIALLVVGGLAGGVFAYRAFSGTGGPTPGCSGAACVPTGAPCVPLVDDHYGPDPAQVVGVVTRGTGRSPVVLLVPGGGWFQACNRDMVALGRRLQTRLPGYALLAIGYRAHADAPYRDEPADVRAAVAWAKRASSAARYGYDARRIGLFGVSAGGQLALLSALGPNGAAPPERVQAVATWGAATDLTAIVRDQGCVDRVCPVPTVYPEFTGWAIGLFERCSLAACPERYRETSPVSFVDPTDPPVFLGHAFADQLVPVGQATELGALLHAAGVCHVVDVVRPREPPASGGVATTAPTEAPAGHFFLPDSVLEATAAFLRDHLSGGGSMGCPPRM